MRQAGLPMALFDQSRISVTTEEMFAPYTAIQEISADPGIGLKLGCEDRPQRYNPVAIAARYSRSFGDALKRIARYERLVPPQEIRITEGPTEAPTWIDMCIAWTVTIGRRVTGRRINPLRVALRRLESAPAAL